MKDVLLVTVLLACAPRPAAPVQTPVAAREPAPPAPSPAPPVKGDPQPPIDFAIAEAFDTADGPVVMGTLAAGRIEVGDALVIARSEPPIVVEVRAVEAIRKPGAAPVAGDTVGLLLTLPAGIGLDALAIGAKLERTAPPP